MDKALRLVAAAGTAAMMTIPALAQDTASTGRVNSSAEAVVETPASLANADAALGYQLANYARRNRDAAMMIQVARILRDLPAAVPTTQGTLSRSDDSIVPSDAAAAQGPTESFASLLAEARQLALGNRALLRQISEVEASAGRGVIGGRLHRYRDVPPATRWSIDVNARGGEALILVARGDGRTNVDMFVYDEYGHEICRDTGRDASPSCRVTPAWSGPFRVRLVNQGVSWTRIRLLTN